MTKQHYVGMTQPDQAFAGLAPYRAELIRMKSRCRPFGTDYLILEAVRAALDDAPAHFTGDPSFYALRRKRPGNPGNRRATAHLRSPISEVRTSL